MSPQAKVGKPIREAERVLSKTAWAPDVFAALYDVLAIDGIWQSVQNRFIDAHRISNRDPFALADEECQFRAELKQAPDRGWAVGEAFRQRALAALKRAAEWYKSTPRSVPDGSGFPVELAYLARSIDAVAMPLSMYSFSLALDRFQGAWENLYRRGTFTLDASGRVIPAAAHCMWGNAPRNFFANLLRVSASDDRWTEYKCHGVIPRPNIGEPLSIGFIPTVQARDEVKWRLEGNDFYVGLNPSHERSVSERVIKAMKWLLNRGTDVIVVPELVSSARLRQRVREWLESQGTARPMLVVGGSEAVRSASATGWTNRAFILGPSGQELWIQDKHHQYALSAEAIKEMGLQRALGERRRNEVGTSSQWKIVVRDVLGAGRFCVLICEDFARPEPGQAVIRAFGVDMSIVIVMDGKFPASGWRSRNALNLAQDPGTRIAIGNSHAVLSRLPQSPANDSATAAAIAYYCLPNQIVTSLESWPKGPIEHARAIRIAPAKGTVI